MTAFGRATITTNIGRFAVEIQSVNRKYLEVNSFIPREFVRFDPDIKKCIGDRIHRGQLNLKLSVALSDSAPVKVTPNRVLARQLGEAWKAIAEEIGSKDAPSLGLLKGESGLLVLEDAIEDEQGFREAILAVCEEAIDRLMEMKTLEGKALEKDILDSLGEIVPLIDMVEEKAPQATERYRKKLKERLEEILPGVVENEERILREISMYAEKVDVSEEIMRLRSHISQFRETVEKSDGGVGKKLDFLVQEMNREANTIASKSNEISVSHAVVDIKGLLERVREQIQNVE